MPGSFDLQRWIRTLRHRAKTFVGARPWLFFPIFRRRSAFDDLLVTQATDLCIEGFPRSGNSFAVGAVEYAQSKPIQIAHHTHVPANAMRACEYGRPTLVLIRDPYDAVVSAVGLNKHVQVKEKGVAAPVQLISFRDHLWAWNTFYQSLTPYRERFLVVPLGAVVEDMGSVIDRVNDRFETDFDPFDHTSEAVAQVHAGRGYHAGPSEQRDALKANIRTDFDEQLLEDTALQSALSRAKHLYNTFVNSSAAIAPS